MHSFISELTCHSPVTLAMENDDMLKILKQLHDLGPWDDSPLLLVHAQRFVAKSSFPLSSVLLNESFSLNVLQSILGIFL